MKTALKILGGLLILLVALGSMGFLYVQSTYERDYSSVEQPNVKASRDPALIAQGEYVVHALAHCAACHQPGGFAKRNLAANPADLRGGGEFKAGPFGTFYPANLTPDPETGLGNVSDALIARAIRHGVDRNGRYAAFMALSLGTMADEDLIAVLSYLRSLPPIKNAVKRDEWGLLAKALSFKFVPRDDKPAKYVPAGGVSVERGEYLANGPAACYTCHSQRDPMAGFAVVGPRFAGNPDAEPDETDASYEFVVPNLTSDPTGRTGLWTEDQFLGRLHGGRVYFGSIMPWESYERMTDDDVRSIYRYLRSLPPVKRDVGVTRRRAGQPKT